MDYYSFTKSPRNGRLSWHSWLTNSGHLSVVDRAQGSESPPAKDRRPVAEFYQQPGSRFTNSLSIFHNFILSSSQLFSRLQVGGFLLREEEETDHVTDVIVVMDVNGESDNLREVVEIRVPNH